MFSFTMFRILTQNHIYILDVSRFDSVSCLQFRHCCALCEASFNEDASFPATKTLKSQETSRDCRGDVEELPIRNVAASHEWLLQSITALKRSRVSP